jgi:DNA replication initiation complex subunit (GINS family)
MDEEEISYKTLRKIQQAEKNSPQITQIKKGFYDEVTSFLHELEKRLEQEKKPQKQMLLAEECQNIEKIIRNIYEQREKKIMLAAIAKARGGNPSVKTLLSEEKTFFDELYQDIVLFRKKIFRSTDEQNEQEIQPTETSTPATTMEKKKETNAKQESNEQHPNTHPVLRIVEEIGSFVGTDNITYTLHKGDIVSLPDDMASMLLNKKAAIQVQESSKKNE